MPRKLTLVHAPDGDDSRHVLERRGLALRRNRGVDEYVYVRAMPLEPRVDDIRAAQVGGVDNPRVDEGKHRVSRHRRRSERHTLKRPREFDEARNRTGLRMRVDEFLEQSPKRGADGSSRSQCVLATRHGQGSPKLGHGITREILANEHLGE